MTRITSHRRQIADLCTMTHAQRRYLQQGPSREWAITQLAAKQMGLITRRQLLDFGLSARAIDYRVAAGHLIRCLPGVYRYPAAPRGWTQDLLATCLWSDGVASHRAAAALWHLAGTKPGIVEITTTRYLNAPDHITLHRADLSGTADKGALGAIPVTSPVRTLIDLAAVVPKEDLELALDDALHRRVVNLGKLGDRVVTLGSRGRCGLATLRTLIAELSTTPRVPTKFERVLAKVLAVPAWPSPEREYEVRDRSRFIARIDFAWPEAKVGVEADSFKWHSSPAAFRRDRERSNELTQRGWRLHRVTWWDAIEHPAEVRASVACLLGVGHII